MRRLINFESRRWRDGDGWHERQIGLLGIIGNCGPLLFTDLLAGYNETGIADLVRSGRGVIVAVARLKSRRWRDGGDCSNGDWRMVA